MLEAAHPAGQVVTDVFQGVKCQVFGESGIRDATETSISKMRAAIV